MKATHEDESFSKNLEFQLEGREFFDCEFSDIDISDKSLKSSKFLGCSFFKCNLSNASLTGASFRDCIFKECKLTGINWATLSSLFDLEFNECQLNFSVFQGTDLKDFKFLRCGLKEADFSGADLQRASFYESDLSGAIFNQSDLRLCDFRGSLNIYLDPRENKIKKARFNASDALALLKAFEIELE